VRTSLILLGAVSATIVASASGCSSDEGDDDGAAGGAAVGGSSGAGGAAGTAGSGGSSGEGKGGSSGKGGASGQGGSAGSNAGTAGTGTGGAAGDGGSGGTAGTSSASGGSSGDAGAGSAEGGAAGSTGMELVGVCAHRAEATVTAGEFSGYEEYVLIGDEGFGDEICIVRFDVTRVGAAPEGCTDCLWSHLVELGNPTVELDENGVCGGSELGLDSAAIAELDGSQVAYGFVPELDGHASIVLTHIESSNSWEAYNNATWDEGTGRFRFDRRNGFCSY
jgi:hypothetical protein